MDTTAAILPGARVRTTHGFIGTVERLEQRGQGQAAQPDYLVVRSDDGFSCYVLPLMLVRRVIRTDSGSLVDLALGSDELRHYLNESLNTGTEAPVPAPSSGGKKESVDASDTELRVPLASEEVLVQKQPVVSGNIHIHKRVETVEQRLNVPVYHEEAVIEHIPPEQYDASTPVAPGEIIIPLVEERLIVQKQSVIREYLRIRKTVVAEQQVVREPLRREFVDVSETQQDVARPEDA
ncbi:MAG TPA: YsnF/AvaK domain-containing protein [Ktedonosporobacter sp.]|nr:YsnF/AvaK domain-containing protein [Ktedonosporobacter sp.]